MKFDKVIEALLRGGTTRRWKTASWEGKCIVRQIPQTVPSDVVPKMTSLPDGIKRSIGTVGLPGDTFGTISYHDQVIIVTLNDFEPVSATSYNPTWEDIFADDWAVEYPED